MNLQGALDRLAGRVVELAQLAIVRLPEVLAAIIVALVALVLSSRLSVLTQRLTRRAGGPTGLAQFVGRVVSSSVLVLGGVVVLYSLGLGQLVLSFVASLGIVGFILGFALQDIARQFASGALLLTLRPFDIGDEIRVKEFQGAVVDVQLLTTVLRSVDGLEVLIPNADVYTSPIVNYSRYGLQRGHVILTSGSVVDLAEMRESLLERVRTTASVIASPAPDIMWGVPKEGKGRIQADVRFWVDCRTADLEEIQSAVTLTLLQMLQSSEDAL